MECANDLLSNGKYRSPITRSQRIKLDFGVPDYKFLWSSLLGRLKTAFLDIGNEFVIINVTSCTLSVVYWRQGEAGRRPGSSHNLKIFF